MLWVAAMYAILSMADMVCLDCMKKVCSEWSNVGSVWYESVVESFPSSLVGF